MGASSYPCVAVFENEAEQTLVIGAVASGQEYRMFWSQRRKLNDASKLTVYRPNRTEVYRIQKDDWRVDWVSFREIGVLISVLNLVLLRECLLVVSPVLVRYQRAMLASEVVHVVEHTLNRDVLLRARIHRNPDLRHNIAEASSYEDICNCLNL